VQANHLKEAATSFYSLVKVLSLAGRYPCQTCTDSQHYAGGKKGGGYPPHERSEQTSTGEGDEPPSPND
jgi:hypothetical protein